MREAGFLILLALTLLANGCRTGPTLAPTDLSAPGWHIRRGQALWQPKTGAPELAGNLLIASNPGGEDFIRFSKDPLEIVLARRTPAGWRLEIPAFHKAYSGPGRAPRRVGWFQLADTVLHGSTATGWTWSDLDDGRWQFANPRTGERMEGFFTP
ncbi:MAG: hypothetical protein MUE94_05310 [Verrucomicrobia bacterium]|nr:hypothetical protein [Verrucomicrobiota bacterium]